MRSGLYREVPSPADQLLSRVQKNVKDAVETLAADHDVLSVPITTYVVTGAIAAGKSIVAFRGNTGQTLTLPQAKAQGSNVSAVLLVLNTSANAVTLKPTAGDTINGALSLSLAAGAVTSLTSDGVAKWLTPVSGGAGVTSFTAGAGLVNSGTAADPIADVVAANGTIVVNANSIEVGIVQTADIAANAVTNVELADMPANTIKGNNTGAPGDPLNLTPAQVAAMLPAAAAGDFDWILTADSTIANNKMRTFAGDFQVPDGFTLTIEDTGVLGIA